MSLAITSTLHLKITQTSSDLQYSFRSSLPSLRYAGSVVWQSCLEKGSVPPLNRRLPTAK